MPSSKRQPSGWTQHTSSCNMMWKCRDLVTYNENIEEGHRTQFWRRGLEGKMANSVNLGLLSMSLLIGYYVLGPAVGAGCYRVNNTDKNLYFHCVVVQSFSDVWFCDRGLQHAWLPCPSLSPGVCSDSHPFNRWCHPTISSSVVRFSLALTLSQHQGLFQRVSFVIAFLPF